MNINGKISLSYKNMNNRNSQVMHTVIPKQVCEKATVEQNSQKIALKSSERNTTDIMQQKRTSLPEKPNP